MPKMYGVRLCVWAISTKLHFVSIQKELHDFGGMAYGKDFNAIALGHRDKDENQVVGSRIWASTRCRARPRVHFVYHPRLALLFEDDLILQILLDYQFMPTCEEKSRRKLCKQAEIAICVRIAVFRMLA